MVSDARGTETLPGTTVRQEGEPATGDAAADEAYDGLGATWDLFSSAYGRSSLDGHGMPMLATVHFGRNYDNAFWDGTQMVFGDGDGRYFRRFTLSLDVIGHELAHGVTEATAGLTYRGQSGALNESVSDVFGSLVRQRALAQDAQGADWLIGADLFTEAVHGRRCAPSRRRAPPTTPLWARTRSRRTWTTTSGPSTTTAASTSTPESPTTPSTSRPRPSAATPGTEPAASGMPH